MAPQGSSSHKHKAENHPLLSLFHWDEVLFHFYLSVLHSQFGKQSHLPFDVSLMMKILRELWSFTVISIYIGSKSPLLEIALVRKMNSKINGGWNQGKVPDLLLHTMQQCQFCHFINTSEPTPQPLSTLNIHNRDIYYLVTVHFKFCIY